jgi:xanthine dehydrogenase molybdopterin-binding subunit B
MDLYIESCYKEELYFKPKQKFPIVFENEYYKIQVCEDGHITAIDKDTLLRANYGAELSLPLLDQAIAKSKEIRGLK